MENKKQLSAVSPNTRNRGHKMKLVGGRLNNKKKEVKREEADPRPTHSRTVEVSATAGWGHQNFACIGHSLMGKKNNQGGVDQRCHSLAQKVIELLGKILWGKYHCNLNLHLCISSSCFWQADIGLGWLSS